MSRDLSGNSDSEKKIFDKVLYVVSQSYVVKEVQKTASKGSYNTQNHVISTRSDWIIFRRLKRFLMNSTGD
jgi:hypothetical protein